MILIKINGQIKGGKNNMLITRSGKHYPKPSYQIWREEVLWQIKQQYKGPPIDKPLNVKIRYYASDKRRRDLPAWIDSLWHCLEKAGVVTDDKFLGGVGTVTRIESVYYPDQPGVEIELY